MSRFFAGMYSWDLSALQPAHADVVKGALAACDFPFGRIRRRTGKKVPVSVADTSRFSVATGVHSHEEDFHVLADHRDAALGLFWLPTAEHPAGRVELSNQIMDNTPLAQEVFLAEAAHAVDYGALTDQDRERIFAIVHGGSSDPHGTHGWWEERGGQGYWDDWVGEVFMALFMRAFARGLPRPLEARQPWAHKVTDEMALQTRRYLRRPIRP